VAIQSAFFAANEGPSLPESTRPFLPVGNYFPIARAHHPGRTGYFVPVICI
jgi:hypothetical protein